ncbi:G-protein-coupled receptor family protein [Cavenderia fasciculata]|uniref:G-protein-coupled receptor family protein n=1 Tax=Cavenderia fasciculata TaxID=261658 RepID=F4PWJ4_CACFS|nr:G-protein-coupled receptor family protein [Cavenderia fasciculata]EGG20358.1 G-protein-coupled receptor family protein [Cavenderia fasciculata]|eukprot:XP_004367341.1 G-protein-coupled receptor family protein [Cavenderia fasciculata]
MKVLQKHHPMLMMLSLTLVIISSLLFGIVNSSYLIDGQQPGTCQVLTSSSYCYPLVSPQGQPVYIPFNVTIDQIETNITSLLSLPLNDECLKPAQLLLCSMYYNPCNNVTIDYGNGTTTPILLPSFPCFNVCETAFQGCSDYIQYLPPNFKCDMNTSSGQQQYPQYQTSFNITLENVTGTGENNYTTELIQCNDKYTGNIVGSCPIPLIFAPNRSKDTYYTISDNCVLPCPFQLWNESEEKAIKDVSLILSVLSFVCSVFLIIFNGILPNKISTTNESILYVALGALFLAISQFQNLGQNNFSCSEDPGRYVTQSDVECGINGFLFQLGAILGLFGWGYASYDFYRTIRLKSIEKIRYIRIVIWSLVALMCFIPFAGQRYGSTLATSGCWITGDKNNPWPYLFFYAEAIPTVLIILLFTGLTTQKLYSVYKQIQSQSMLLYDIKLMVVMVLIIFNSTFVLSFKFYMDKQTDDIRSRIADWVQCIAQNGESSCDLNIPDYSLRILQVITTNSWGILGFIAFALDASSLALIRQSNRANKLLKYFGWEFKQTKSLTGTGNHRLSKIIPSNTATTSIGSTSSTSDGTTSTITIQSNVPNS